MLGAIRLMPPLSATLAPLCADPVEGLEAMRTLGYRAVQLSATQPGLRPRDLDASARRDLAARLRRMEMTCSGIDLWIPQEHFAQPAHAERAVDAVAQAARLAEALGRVTLSLSMPRRTPENAVLLDQVRVMVEAAAAHAGVSIADHGEDAVRSAFAGDSSEPLGVGIDPAMVLSWGEDPSQVVVRCSGRIRSARVVDMLRSGMRAPPGEADGARLRLDEYVLALAGAGYRSSAVVDARHWADPRAGLARVRALWQEEA